MPITNDFNTKITPATVVGKQRAYVNIPVFDEIASGWIGASRVIALFNYSATNNFTIESVVGEEGKDFIACIRWISEDGEVFRYKLWDDNNGILFVPLYNGEFIGKYFAIEIWSTDTASDNFENDAVVTINLSILKGKTSLDNSDTYENVASVRCANFSAALITLPNLTNLQIWYDLNQGVTAPGNRITQVLDLSGNARHLVPYAGATTQALVVGLPYIVNPAMRFGMQFDDVGRAMVSTVANGVFSFGSIYMLIQQQTWVNDDYIAIVLGNADASRLLIRQQGGSPGIRIINVGSSLTATRTSSALPAIPPDNFYIVRCRNTPSGTGAVNIQVADLDSIIDQATSGGGTTAIADVNRILFGVVGNAANYYVSEILVYSDLKTVAEDSAILQYLMEKYALRIPAPLAFEDCVAVTN